MQLYTFLGKDLWLISHLSPEPCRQWMSRQHDSQGTWPLPFVKCERSALASKAPLPSLLPSFCSPHCSLHPWDNQALTLEMREGALAP